MTDCGQCGSCCDPVTLSFSPEEWIVKRAPERTFVDPAWVWQQHEFIRDHWSTIGVHDDVYLVKCDKFNRETRQCEAYEDRPDVCSRFPWYGEEPDLEHRSANALSPRCTFNADVRTMLPIVSINGK
jgi:Fe-S-cluster containining protein